MGTDSVAIRTSPSYSGMTSCRLSLCLLAVAGLPGTVLTVSTTQQNIMDDIVGVWGQYRDPLNGFWCDTLRFTSGTQTPCGPSNNFYSGAGTGMGLLSEAIMTELGYQTREEAETRLTQSLTSLLTEWPRENFSGFMVHFTNRDLQPLSEFSTIDTTILVLGALFAGNYFGGQVEQLALQLRDATQWSDAIKLVEIDINIMLTESTVQV